MGSGRRARTCCTCRQVSDSAAPCRQRMPSLFAPPHTAPVHLSGIRGRCGRNTRNRYAPQDRGPRRSSGHAALAQQHLRRTPSQAHIPGTSDAASLSDCHHGLSSQNYRRCICMPLWRVRMQIESSAWSHRMGCRLRRLRHALQVRRIRVRKGNWTAQAHRCLCHSGRRSTLYCSLANTCQEGKVHRPRYRPWNCNFLHRMGGIWN